MTANQIVITRYDPPSILGGAFDWNAVTDHYQPGHPIGYGYTREQAITHLLTQLKDD